MQNDRQVRSSRTRLASTIEQFRQKLEADKAARIAAQNHDYKRELADLRQRLALLEQIDGIAVKAPRWATEPPKRKGKRHVGIPTLVLSDCHFDEVVNPDEVEGVNEYNREIALKRLQRVLRGTIDVSRNYLSGLTYEGFVLMLGGDLLSGNIHEELVQTNADTVLGSVDYWADPLSSFIDGLVSEYGKLHVAAVVGNHGRNTRKPRSKLRVRDNFDWLLYRIIARHFRTDSRITWQVPESADCDVKIYDVKCRLTHGDQFRGGSGIAGMLSPLLLGQARKSMRQVALANPFDKLIMGHFHSYFDGKGILVNGTNKGYDEYAYLQNFRPEPPQQAFFVTTPERGITFSAPIFAESSR